MIALTLVLVAQLAQASVPPRPAPPVLAFPEAGLDDPQAYQGYATRFYRDAAGNTVQVYLDGRSGRVVHLLADAENESLGFTARTSAGRPAALTWGDGNAVVAARGGRRSFTYSLRANTPRLVLGHFLAGSMRFERDLQYAGRHLAPFGAPPFHVQEYDRLLAALDRLPPATRREHLALLDAAGVAQLRARLRPTLTAARRDDGTWGARVAQPSLDGRDTLRLEIEVDPRRVAAARLGDTVVLTARGGASVPFTVRVSTAAPALTPLAREEIFTKEFLDGLAQRRAEADAAGAGDSAVLRARWQERQVRGVELLASREKLMAGLPAYATYFGRDQLMTALMMRPIWREAVSESVIASVLRKLGPDGDVSHEEALGGQAVREAAGEYAALVDAQLRARAGGDVAAADSLLALAADVLRHARRVRENYHMVDDDLQLPVLVARWIADPELPAAHKRAFLLDSSETGEPRVVRLVRELALVARMTAPYAANPTPTNLVSFPARDAQHWSSASWRDSGAGYAGGRYAMDVNAIWAPHALESVGGILAGLRALGFPTDSLAARAPELARGTPLGRLARDTVALARAVDAWWGAARHFVVALSPAEVRRKVRARIAAMPAAERAYWTRALADVEADGDSLVFLALSLDSSGRPIGVANSDPATGMFLGDGARGAAVQGPAADRVLRDLRPFVRPYPVGLLVEGVGPVVANDAYATPPVWQAFANDLYHSPKVVWGREVNLFLMGVASRVAEARRDSGSAEYVRALRGAADRVRRAVEASGFRSELWSYELRGGRVVPVRYGSGSDVQLWSTTDLAVQWALSRLGETGR